MDTTDDMSTSEAYARCKKRLQAFLHRLCDATKVGLGEGRGDGKEGWEGDGKECTKLVTVHAHTVCGASTVL